LLPTYQDTLWKSQEAWAFRKKELSVLLSSLRFPPFPDIIISHLASLKMSRFRVIWLEFTSTGECQKHRSQVKCSRSIMNERCNAMQCYAQSLYRKGVQYMYGRPNFFLFFESASISLGDFPIVHFPMWVSYRPQTTDKSLFAYAPLLVKYTNAGKCEWRNVKCCKVNRWNWKWICCCGGLNAHGLSRDMDVTCRVLVGKWYTEKKGRSLQKVWGETRVLPVWGNDKRKKKIKSKRKPKWMTRIQR